MINLRKGPVLDQFPLRLKRTSNLHPRLTRAHSQPIHTIGTRTGTFCKDNDDSEKVAALFEAFWPGKISGMSYKSDRCDRCVMCKLCRSVLFLRLAGMTPAVIWESWTTYSMWAIMISPSAYRSRGYFGEMGAFDEDGVLFIMVMMQIYATFQEHY